MMKPPPSSLQQKLTEWTAKLEAIADWPRQRALRKKEAEKQRLYATFNERVFASVIDTALSFLLLAPFLKALSEILYGNSRSHVLAGLPENATIGVMIAYLRQTEFFHYLFLDYALHFILFGVVILWFWQMGGATPGKYLLRLRIVDAETFRKPSPKQLLVRYAGYAVSLIPFTLGFAWIMVDKRGRAWHDMMADTVVIRVKHWKWRDEGEVL